MDVPRANYRASHGRSPSECSRPVSGSGAMGQITGQSGERPNESPASSSVTTSPSSSPTSSEKRRSLKGLRLSRAMQEPRRPHPRHFSGGGGMNARYDGTWNEQPRETKRGSVVDGQITSRDADDNIAARDMRYLEKAQHRKRTCATPTASETGPPVPAQRRDVSPPRSAPARMTSCAKLNDGKDVTERATLGTEMVKDREKAATRRHKSFCKRDERQALIARKSTLLAVKDGSILESPMCERPAAAPAQRQDTSVQPVPLKRSSLFPTAKPRSAPRSPSLENALSSIDDTPYVTALTSLPTTAVVAPEEPSSLPTLRDETNTMPTEAKTVLERFPTRETPWMADSTNASAPTQRKRRGTRPGGGVVPYERGKLKRRSTCCAPALRHDESVNDSLRGTMPLSPEHAEQTTAAGLDEQPPVSPRTTDDANLEKLKASSKNVGSVSTSSKISKDATGGGSAPARDLTNELRAAENMKSTFAKEGARPTTVIRDTRAHDKKGSKKSQQGARASCQGRHATDERYAVAQESSRSAAVPRSAHTAFQSGSHNLKTHAEKQTAENVDKSVAAAEAPNRDQKTPAVNDNVDVQGTTAVSEDPDGEERGLPLHAKAVKIAPEHTAIPLSSSVSSDASREGGQAIEPQEANLWLEDCRSACENVTTVVAFVLVVIILYGVARPMYVRESSLQVNAAAPCHDEWCDRLGLWLLPNKSHQETDPCDDFYERVCFEWNVGRENTSFVSSVVDSAYSMISERISRGPMPPVTRNDLDQFVAFLKVCLADPSFNDTVSEWMSLIRYEMRDDFLVPQTWNWSRMIQAVIKKSLLYGLQTIVGVRVGHRQDDPNKAGLFLSVDGCLISLFSLTSNDTRAIMSLLREIIDELPEFRNVTNAATQVKRMALAVHLKKRGQLVMGSMTCQNLSFIARGVEASTWLEEINRYVPATSRLDRYSIVHFYETIHLRDLFPALEEYPIETRALYINVLMVGQILQYRYDHVTRMLPKLRVCMHASRNAFRNQWAKLMMDAASLQVQVKYLGSLFENVKEGVILHLERRQVSDLTKLAVVALVNKTKLRPMSSVKTQNDAIYRAPPQLAIGYHMPQYFLQTSSFQSQRSINQLVDAYGLIDDKGENTLKPMYNMNDLTISVHFLLLFPPVFYVYREEQFHNFATLGVLLALELIREAGRRSLLDWRVANASARCQVDTESDARELFNWELALGSALGSLEMYARQRMSPVESLIYGKRLKQVFFERFCMLSCKLPGITTRGYKQRCMLPLLNVAEFAVTYHCANKSTHWCSDL